MSVRARSCAVYVMAVLLTILLRAPAQAQNVLATSHVNPTRTNEFPALARNPLDPQIAVLSGIEMQGGRCWLDRSTDGGRSWTPAASPQTPAYPNCSLQSGNLFNTNGATSLRFGSDGTLYYAFTAAPAGELYSRSILLGRSHDGGKHFETVIVYAASRSTAPEDADVNFQASVAVDPDSAGRVYVAFRRAYAHRSQTDSVYLAVSRDGGAHFGAPVFVDHGYAPYLLAARGVVYVFYTRAPSDTAVHGSPVMIVARSHDGGRTFTYAKLPARGTRFSSPVAALDSARGMLVAAWDDNRLSTPTHVQDAVYVSRSTDGGRTWAPAVPVDPVKPRPGKNANQFYPAISVAPDGRVDVLWYDYRDDPAAPPKKAPMSYLGSTANVLLASSSDGAATFDSPTQVNDRPIDRRYGTWNDQYFLVAPPALASLNRSALAAWSDTRNANGETQSQDIYTSRLRIGPGGRVLPSHRLSLWWLEGGVALTGALLLLAALMLRIRRVRTPRRA